MTMVQRQLSWAAVWVLVAGVSTAWAVRPQAFTETSADDFLAGVGENVAISSQGELVLTRSRRELLAARDDVEMVNALAELPDGSLLAATGPKGLLLKIAPDGKVSTVFSRPRDPYLLSLLPLADGRVLIGTGGEQARILALSADGKVSVLATPDDVSHVWALAADAKGNVFAGTGPSGQVLKIDPAGKVSVFYEARQSNILSLAVAADGRVFAGTDEDGLIYRLDDAGKPFVVYNASEPEVVALAFDAKGRLLAATAGEVEELSSGSESESVPAEGRPEGEMQMKIEGGEGESAAEEPHAGDAAGAAASQPHHGGDAAESKTRPPGHASDGEKQGPAVYLIDANGFVNELHRFTWPVLCLATVGEEIWVGAGEDGWLDVLRPAAGEVLAYAQLPCSEVTAIVVRKSGAVAVATANSGQVFEFEPKLARQGTFTSQVLDAKQVVAFGRVGFDSRTPEGSGVTISTRSGNTHEADDDLWSAWTAGKPTGEPAGSPAARFLQYRVTLTAGATGAGPVVSEVQAIYQAANRHPNLADFQTASAGEGGHSDEHGEEGGKSSAAAAPSKEVELEWTGTDPNEDTLVYTLWFRLVGTTKWILLKDRLAEAKFTWDTRGVPDGRYELKLEASDAPDNAPGTELTHTLVGRPLTVDNVAPVVTLGAIKPEGRKATVSAEVRDNLSRIVSVHFALDSQDQWRAAAAGGDGIFDSPQEAATIALLDLAPGAHVLAVKAIDAAGNVGYATAEFTVPGGAATATAGSER